MRNLAIPIITHGKRLHKECRIDEASIPFGFRNLNERNNPEEVVTHGGDDMENRILGLLLTVLDRQTHGDHDELVSRDECRGFD